MTLEFHSGSKSSSQRSGVPAAKPLDTRLEALRERIVEAVNAGQVEEADRLSLEAFKLAKSEGSAADVDHALGNRANILIALGRGAEVVSELRKMLMRTTDPSTRFTAAYAISRHHSLQGESERSMFYARQALRCAEEENEADLLAKGHNMVANLLLRDSYFAEACVSYEDALKYIPPGYQNDRAGILSNLGYCHAVLGKISIAFRHLMASLRMMRRLKAGGWSRFPHLSLAYAYLEIGRHQRAIQHAEVALEISENTAGAEEQVKNSLYLLGDAYKICGRDAVAYEHFLELQKRFYPEQPFIVDVLMATDVRKMINLMA